MNRYLALAVAMSFSIGSQAASMADSIKPFQYTFVEAQYVDMRNDNLNKTNTRSSKKASLDGLRINGSFKVHADFNVIGSVFAASDSGYDLTVITMGGAFHQALPAIDEMPFDFIIRAEIEQVDIDVDIFKGDDSQTGIAIGGGVQLGILHNIQAFSDVVISSNDYREFALSAGARYKFIPNLSGVASIEIGDATSLALGIRYYF
jgi:hypothetical protein